MQARIVPNSRWLRQACCALALFAAGCASDEPPQPAPEPDTVVSAAPYTSVSSVAAGTAEAERLFSEGDYLGAARERVTIEPQLFDPRAIEANRAALWQALLKLTPQALSELRTAPPPDVLSGWMELAIIRQDAMSSAPLDVALNTWQSRYPKHPASAELTRWLQGETTPSGYPARIALLLPLSGRHAAQGIAVRNGFLAAYYSAAANGSVPLVSIHDSGGATPIRTLYDQLATSGANLIVGPLTRPALTSLVNSGPLTVPVLALNYLERAPPQSDKLTQFGLAPEDEAQQVAERGTLDGHTRALALVPAGEWGARVLANFRERFKTLGGELADYAIYEPGAAEEAVERLLQPRDGAMRSDAQFLFLAATPSEARLIRPLLNYHHGEALPIYALSSVYEPRAAAAETDLEGIVFCDIPWTLASSERVAVARIYPEAEGHHARLYALGADAFRLIPRLTQLRKAPGTHVDGATGSLTLDNTGRIRRRLSWARFSTGVPVLIGTTP
jgi:hypothetical protein